MAKKTKKTTKRNTNSNTETRSARGVAPTVNRTAAQDRANRNASGTLGSSGEGDSQRGRQFNTNYSGGSGSMRTEDRTDNATSSERGPNRNQRSPSPITPPKRDAPFFLK
jgi:hypothetical protein